MIYKAQKSILVILLLFTQLTFAQDSSTADKKNGRFITTIDVDTLRTLDNGVSGQDMIKSASLTIQWWTLLGQPVYHYKFKWNIKDEVSFWHKKTGNNVHLYLDDLQAYPKLQKRFKQLKPSNLEIKLYATLIHHHSGGFASGESYRRFGDITYYKNDSTENWFRFISNLTIKHIPELLITTSGKVGDNLTPASPKDFAEFFDGSVVENLLYSDSKNSVNEKLALTYKLADKIEFSFAKISKIELPIRELTAIYDALQKEKENTKETQSLDELLEDDLEEESNDFQNLDDLLEEDTYSDTNTGDFLADYDETDQENTADNTNNDPFAGADSEDLLENSQNEIKKVRKKIDSHTCNGTWNAFQTGYADKNGEFIDSSELTFEQHNYGGSPVSLMTLSYNPKTRYQFSSDQAYQSYITERRERKRRAAIKKQEEERKGRIIYEKCKSEIEQWKSQIRSQYN